MAALIRQSSRRGIHARKIPLNRLYARAWDDSGKSLPRKLGNCPWRCKKLGKTGGYPWRHPAARAAVPDACRAGPADGSGGGPRTMNCWRHGETGRRRRAPRWPQQSRAASARDAGSRRPSMFCKCAGGIGQTNTHRLVVSATAANDRLPDQQPFALLQLSHAHRTYLLKIVTLYRAKP